MDRHGNRGAAAGQAELAILQPSSAENAVREFEKKGAWDEQVKNN
jgi:hypothetical protein